MPVNVRTRPDNGKLLFDFQFRGQRCRECTALDDTVANRRLMKARAKTMSAELELGTFEYRRYFPNSKKAAEFDAPARSVIVNGHEAPTFEVFVEQWLSEMDVCWREATRQTNTATINRHLLPAFGKKKVSDISKADILQFRASLAKVPGRNGNATLTPKTINHTIGVLKSILAEAADRYEFTDPGARVKPLPNPRKDIQPFTLEEVRLIIESVRPDFRHYFTVRFFTGMRTAETHGLKWSNVDFDRGQILIRETFHHGRTEYTKTDGSQREIEMSSTVRQALEAQAKVTRGKSEYVFCTKAGTPLDTKNVTDRVWYPLLRHLGLKLRRPYQCRHTAATLWLAAGENPEWIARQLGHTTTQMLFRVYSRYVPNLTRRDGSAFDRLLLSAMNGGVDESKPTPEEVSDEA